MAPAVVLSAVRTPIGKFGGALQAQSAAALGAIAIRAALERAHVAAEAVEDVLLGCAIQAGLGQNVARQAARGGGVPDTIPALTVNQVCASGLRAVALAAQAIRAGEAELVVAGGTESMSQAPYLLPRARWGQRFGHGELRDAALHDGLEEADSSLSMGEIAERWADRYGITREEQDRFALSSQQKVRRAREGGGFDDEIVPTPCEPAMAGGTARCLEEDEHPRPQVTLEQLTALPSAFASGGTITAGNASGLNDGAAALVLASEAWAQEHGLAPLARILSYAWSAREPHEFGIAPAQAIAAALERAALPLNEIDLIECNEAFAVQVLALTREVGWELERVNVHGGAIALGHPIGASGARILATLVHALRRRSARYGLATLCAGGGMGIAMVVERL